MLWLDSTLIVVKIPLAPIWIILPPSPFSSSASSSLSASSFRLLSSSFSGLVKDEDKGSTEFINLSADAQSAGVGQLFKIYGDAHHVVAQKRQQFVRNGSND